MAEELQHLAENMEDSERAERFVQQYVTKIGASEAKKLFLTLLNVVESDEGTFKLQLY